METCYRVIRVDNKICLISKTQAVKINPSDEVNHRTFIVCMKCTENGAQFWVDLFQIKRQLLDKAGIGLFVLMRFKKGEQMGVFYGRVIEKGNKSFCPSAYAIETDS